MKSMIKIGKVIFEIVHLLAGGSSFGFDCNGDEFSSRDRGVRVAFPFGVPVASLSENPFFRDGQRRRDVCFFRERTQAIALE